MAEKIRLGRSLRRAIRRKAERARLDRLLAGERERLVVSLPDSELRAKLDMDGWPCLRFLCGDHELATIGPEDAIILRDFLIKHFPPKGQR